MDGLRKMRRPIILSGFSIYNPLPKKKKDIHRSSQLKECLIDLYIIPFTTGPPVLCIYHSNRKYFSMDL